MAESFGGTVEQYLEEPLGRYGFVRTLAQETRGRTEHREQLEAFIGRA